MKIIVGSMLFVMIVFSLGEAYGEFMSLRTVQEKHGWRIEHVPSCGQNVTIRAYVGDDNKLVIACTTDNDADAVWDKHGYLGKIARLTR